MRVHTGMKTRPALWLALILSAVIAGAVWLTWPAQAQTLPVIQFKDSDIVSITEGNSNTYVYYVYLEVSITPAPTQDAIVKYRVKSSGTTATEGQDFGNTGTTTVPITTGTDELNILINILADDYIENTERLTIELFDPTGLALGTPTTKEIHIFDIDQPDPIGIVPSGVTVNEGAGTIDFTVLWDPNVAYAVVLGIIALPGSGTNRATVGEDFVQFPEQLIRFEPRDTHKELSLTILEDDLPEGDETVEIHLLRNGSDQTKIIFGNSTLEITIIDDAEITFEEINVIVDEPENPGETVNAEVVVQLTRPDVDVVTVDYETVDDSAKSDEGDYDARSGTLTFNPGETEKTVYIPVHGDDLTEDRHHFRVNFSNNAGAPFKSDGRTRVSISDNDPIPIVTTSMVPAVEGSDIVFTLHADRPTTKYYSVVILPQPSGSTATQGNDFDGTSKTINMPRGHTSASAILRIYQDNEKELPEFILVQTLAGSLSTYAELHPDHNYTKAWIIDDDSDQGFVVTTDDNADQQVRKKRVGVREGHTGEYQIWMTAPPTEPVKVTTNLGSDDPDLTLNSQASRIFDDDNWFEPYRIEVEAAQDSDTVDGMVTSRHEVVTDDPFYENESPRFVLVSERDDDPDQDGRKTHSEDLGVSPKVTATLEHAPRRHNGKEFFMSIRFSEPVRGGYANMRDYALQANDAQVMRAFRIYGQSDLWGFVIRPRHNDNISLWMEGNKPCHEDGAICSRSGSKRLGNTLTVAIAGNNGEDAKLPPRGDGRSHSGRNLQGTGKPRR